ncbi:unnamed protein product [Peronospora destructor]|uniref:Uncharacterized protein n=1 Tax=Peronospora destructor TaxID=86335 RepID=A0AAV0UJ98_9STRA|nr:unnamed protein product [Peronospora destructor]
MSKKIVIEEEEYTETLGQIIERDFFPDLPKLKKQTELLQDEEESLSWTDTTLRSIETDLERDEQDQNTGGNIKGSMTLNRFVATHTSEDNESFRELQEKAVKDHQRRYHWAFDDDKGDPKLHLLTDGTWISREQRRIADEACASKEPKDERPSAPETWKFRARNPLLFSPNLEATRDICGIEAGFKSQLLLENNGRISRVEKPPRARKMTVYANSRFPCEDAQKEYPLVPMTPLIAPGVDASPLVTWGNIEGTPAILRATPARISNAPGFELQDTSRREKLANRLESEARHRSINSRPLGIKTPSRKRLKAGQTPVPSSVRSRIPGVRSVLQTPLGSDAQLRASYSTPLRPPRDSSKARKIR